MALYHNICFLSILVSMTKGNLTTTNWTTVLRFNPLYSENIDIVLEPKVPITNSTGYSMCLKICIWKMDNTVLFDSPALKLEMYIYGSDSHCFTMKRNRLFCFTLGKNSSEWNTICFTNNFTDFLLNVTLNGIQMGSKKTQLISNLMDELKKPISIGFNTSFWGQITDFNIWNRPLSNDEVNQYSFGCQEGLSIQPEILDWSNTSIISRGINSQPLNINRQFLPCQNGMSPFTLFDNTLTMPYTNSVEFCNLLKGHLFDPAYLRLGQGHGYYLWYWVPIQKAGENSPQQLENNTQAGKQTSNSILTTGKKTDQCKCLHIASREYISRDCRQENPSLCKVNAHQPIFTLPNLTSPYLTLPHLASPYLT